MVNYKAIADEASKYSYYEAAYAVMSLETTDEYKELSSNNLREWATTYQPDYTILKNDGNVLAEMALKQINIEADLRSLTLPALSKFTSSYPFSVSTLKFVLPSISAISHLVRKMPCYISSFVFMR